ncbi:MAG: type II secretion system protein GspD, partial [Rhodanobacter sp.]
MESSGNTKILSEPSLVVMNNQLANIQVGNEIPVNQSFITPGLGNTGSTGGIGTLGEVTYKSTGVILKVIPRVNPGGLVYLQLSQEVSAPGVKDNNGNFPIQKRLLQTKVAVQSGQTVLLGGLIQQSEGSADTGIPLLNKLPLIGRLFGSTDRHRNRTELLVLITPRVIASGDDARDVTSEYQRKFESLAPLRAKPAAATQP